jgi:predicted alpha/beta hydrolase family esterase
MLQHVLFIQGGGEGAHAIDAQLVLSLARELGVEYQIRYPVMPHEVAPEYQDWKAAILAELRDLGPGALLVAHSVGGAVIVRLLAEAGLPRQLIGLFLIAAPYIGDGGWELGDGFKTPLNLEVRVPQNLSLYLYQGTSDAIVPSRHLELYAKVLPGAAMRRLRDRDHQLNQDLSEVAQDIATVVASARPHEPA